MSAEVRSVFQFPCAASATTRRTLRKDLDAALRIADGPVIVDLSECDTLDGADIDLLLHCLAQTAGCDTELVLVARPHGIRVLLDVVRISSLVSVFSSVEKALGYSPLRNSRSESVWPNQCRQHRRAEMNRSVRRFAKFLSIILLCGVFLIASEAPMMACAPQSSQSEAGAQNSNSSVPETPQPQAPQSSESQPAPQPQATQSSDQQTAQPSAAQGSDQPTAQPSAAQGSDQQPTLPPSGAAGAKASDAKGAPAAQPVGAAVAPARQHSHRSLLIKVGLVAGAAIAVGTVVAFSAKSPTRPPGAPPVNSHP